MFTNLVESFVVRGAEFADLWSLKNNSLHSLVSNYRYVYGTIFLSKLQTIADDNSGDKNYVGGANNSGGGRVAEEIPDGGRRTPRYARRDTLLSDPDNTHIKFSCRSMV